MQARAVAILLLVLAVLGANAASQESGEDPIDAVSGTVVDRATERFTRPGVVLDEHFRVVESGETPAPAAIAAQAEPAAPPAPDRSPWTAIGIVALLVAAGALFLARRGGRRRGHFAGTRR